MADYIEPLVETVDYDEELDGLRNIEPIALSEEVSLEEHANFVRTPTTATTAAASLVKTDVVLVQPKSSFILTIVKFTKDGSTVPLQGNHLESLILGQVGDELGINTTKFVGTVIANAGSVLTLQVDDENHNGISYTFDIAYSNISQIYKLVLPRFLHSSQQLSGYILVPVTLP